MKTEQTSLPKESKVIDFNGMSTHLRLFLLGKSWIILTKVLQASKCHNLFCTVKLMYKFGKRLLQVSVITIVTLIQLVPFIDPQNTTVFLLPLQDLNKPVTPWVSNPISSLYKCERDGND